MEGGAMVLADGGVVCIDEFDKVHGVCRAWRPAEVFQRRLTVAFFFFLPSLFLPPRVRRCGRTTVWPSTRPWSSRPSPLRR